VTNTLAYYGTELKVSELKSFRKRGKKRSMSLGKAKPQVDPMNIFPVNLLFVS